MEMGVQNLFGCNRSELYVFCEVCLGSFKWLVKKVNIKTLIISGLDRNQYTQGMTGFQECLSRKEKFELL